MKNCKKILAMMLTLVMVISMCAFTVSADRITHSPVAADAEKLITLWDAEHWTVPEGGVATKTSTTVWINHYSSDSPAKKSFGLTGKTNSGSSVAVVDDPTGAADNKVLKVNSNLLQNNYRTWFNDTYSKRMGDNDVLTFSSRMMVPSKQAEGVDAKAVTRYWDIDFYVKVDDGKNAKFEDVKGDKIALASAIGLKANYNTAGQLEVSASASNIITGRVVNNPVVVEEDEFFTVRFECLFVDGTNLQYAVYVNDELASLFYSEKIYNKSLTDESGVTTNYAAGVDILKFVQSDLNATTYIDETKFASHKAECIPVYAVGTTKQADPIEVAAKGNTGVLTNIGFYGKTIQQSSTTSVATTYSRDTETVPGETLININTSGKGTTRLISNIREPISDLPVVEINETTPTYIVNSIDLYIPSGTESVEREFYFSNTSAVRADGASDDTTFKSGSTIYYVVVKGGKLTFEPSLGTNVVEKPFVKKVEDVTFPSDKLVNVKIVWEVTGTEAAGYDVKFYGIVDGEVTYVSEYDYPAGEFGLSGFNIDVKNSSSKAVAIDTKVDNINIAAYTNYTIPEKTWNLVDYAYPTIVTVNGNTVNAKGLIVNSSTDKLDAVVAFYDVNGKLIAPLAKTTLTKSGNDFSIEANAEIPEGAATAKVFFFDSLATAKPVMKSAKITIE